MALAAARAVNIAKADWKRHCRALWREIQDDQLSNGAAALAFYMVLALFPLAIFGLSVLPYLQVENLEQAVMDLVSEALPRSAADLLTNTVRSVVSQRSSGLLSFGFVFALWSATSGLHGLMQQLNVVYEVEEERTFLRARALALVLTVAFFGLVVGALGLITCGGMLQEYIGNHLGWSGGLRMTFAGLRWVIIILALHSAFSLIYHLGPNLHRRFEFVTPGSAAATVAMLLASLAFKSYVNRFSDYDALYGSLGAVIVLLLWLFAAGWVILFGAELNDVLSQAGSRRSELPAGDELVSRGTSIGVDSR
jgi:membrane protein